MTEAPPVPHNHALDLRNMALKVQRERSTQESMRNQEIFGDLLEKMRESAARGHMSEVFEDKDGTISRAVALCQRHGFKVVKFGGKFFTISWDKP